MKNRGLHRVISYKNKWLTTYLAETAILGLIVFILTISITEFISPELTYIIGIGFLITSLPLLFLTRGYKKISISNVLRLLSTQNTELQYSADLMTKDDIELTKLEQLQKNYVNDALLDSQINFAIPNKLKSILTFMLICITLYFLSTFLKQNTPQLKNTQTALTNDDQIEPTFASHKRGIKNVKIKITPPTYTQQRKQNLDKWDIIAPEGSVIDWEITFHEKVNKPFLRFSDKTIQPLNKRQSTYFSSINVDSRLLYELIYIDAQDNEVFSDFHKIDVIYDIPPQIKFSGVEQFSEHDFDAINKFDLETQISDDYGVSNAFIVATIAQGTGESVMFREEKISFDTNIKVNAKDISLSKYLDLKSFKMQPGDELYFYIEAKDNCVLKNNTTRTETYIISIRDTSTYVSSMEGGLGVDLMPEYFRSQRQIIIDTEKLLKNKPKLKKQVFNATSNELGFDQKSLRLKYGQFLGEEDESGIAIEDHESEEEELSVEEGGEEKDALDGFKHDHDHEDEHEKTNEGDKQEDPLEKYQHTHDSEEVATFFSNTLKGKLKAAMSFMWDSELYLRLYEPETSLPYQYKALKLIKEIKNHARVYVHRIGFDPPPIKEESRLSADLSDVKNNRLQSYDTIQDYPGIRKVIMFIASDIENSAKLNSSQIDILQEAGNELAQIVIDNPGNYIYSLKLLRDWINGKVLSAQSLSFLRNELINSLPEHKAYSSQEYVDIDPLAKTYLQILEKKLVTDGR